MSVMKTSLTIIPMCPREHFPLYKSLSRLVLCYKKDWSISLHLIYLLPVTNYLITKLSVIDNFSACREYLTENCLSFPSAPHWVRHSYLSKGLRYIPYTCGSLGGVSDRSTNPSNVWRHMSSMVRAAMAVERMVVWLNGVAACHGTRLYGRRRSMPSMVPPLSLLQQVVSTCQTTIEGIDHHGLSHAARPLRPLAVAFYCPCAWRNSPWPEHHSRRG